VRIGVSLRTSYPITMPRAAAWIVERARAADAAGLDSLFVGDHHATGPEPYHQNVPVLGRLLAEWGDRPVGALFLLPLWPPVLLAEQVGTLAALARGRFVLQTALGGGRGQFAAMGVEPEGRVRRFEAGLELVRRLLAGERVSDPDGPFGVRDACVAPVPSQPVEVWIGATVPAAIDRAARLGDGWLANADLVPDDAGAQARTYLERCSVHGRIPTAIAVRRDVHVADDLADALAARDRAVAAGYRGFRPEALVAGDVETVVETFRGYAELGYTDVLVRHFVDDQTAVLRSLELLGEVRARLQG
jgi:alkanesulfonate monooxygenase SsuD/methylene tetrahydromethanopterin reductase-like flavin-dependent oxidoreductase (luciferase family)